jgi:hypothetical protein
MINEIETVLTRDSKVYLYVKELDCEAYIKLYIKGDYLHCISNETHGVLTPHWKLDSDTTIKRILGGWEYLMNSSFSTEFEFKTKFALRFDEIEEMVDV